MRVNTSHAPNAASPLWIIALFIALSEVASGVAAIVTDGVTQTMFTVFSVSFPVIVLGAFVWLLTKHPMNLYSPGQYPEHTKPSEFAEALGKPTSKQQQAAALGQILAEVASEAATRSSSSDPGEREEAMATRLSQVLRSAGEAVGDALLIDTDSVVEEGADTFGEFAIAAGEKASAAPSSDLPHGNASLSDLDDLAERYNTIRASEQSGFERTNAMTAVVTSMMRISAHVVSHDWPERLASTDRGKRLSAYAYLHVRPVCESAALLASTLTDREDKPFGQYWALKALRRVLGTCDGTEAQHVARSLLPLTERFGPGTDRRRELDQLLHETGLLKGHGLP